MRTKESSRHDVLIIDELTNAYMNYKPFLEMLYNGKNYKCRVRVDFWPVNLRPSKDLAFKIDVPAQTEVFALIFNIK